MFFGLGEDRGSTGLLISIHDQEGIVKLDHENGDLRMLQLKYLCKFKDEAKMRPK